MMVDDRLGTFPAHQDLIEQICHRRFGVGADGLILLRNEAKGVRMVYFNSDGRPSSMCGNGGRCFAAFGHAVGALPSEGEFLAVDGAHSYSLSATGQVTLGMNDVTRVEQRPEGLFLNTGSPHVVVAVPDPDNEDLIVRARAIRYNDHFKAEGVNVNLIALQNGVLRVRTYERGVEDETYSCGTGVTAAAMAAQIMGLANAPVDISTKGGPLRVDFNYSGGVFTRVRLIGPATKVFSGTLSL